MKKVVLFFVLIAVATLAAVSIANTNTPGLNLGSEVKNAKENPAANKIVVKVNGKPITLRMYEENYATQKAAKEQLGLPEPTKQEIINNLARGILMLEEAKRKGIEVSDSEVQEYLDQNRASVESVPEEGNRAFIEILKGMGMTAEEYWSSRYAFEAHKRGLIGSKLKEEFTKKATAPGDYEKAERDFAVFIEDLLNKASVEVIESD